MEIIENINLMIEKVDQAILQSKWAFNEVQESEFGNVRKRNMTEKGQGIAKTVMHSFQYISPSLYEQIIPMLE